MVHSLFISLKPSENQSIQTKAPNETIRLLETRVLCVKTNETEDEGANNRSLASGNAPL